MIAKVAALFLVATPALGIEVGGGGSAARDCLVTLQADANTPASDPKHIRCVDGDPCDSDGTVDGVCSFVVSVCANSTTLDPSCTLNGVQSITVLNAEDNGDPRFDVDFQALQTRITNEIDPPTSTANDCTATGTIISVPIKGPYGRGNHCGANKKRLKISSRSEVIDGKILIDNDKMKLYCLPAPDGCTPTDLFTSTFDRIQRQVFNQNCALSGCHDSQTSSGDLVLEIGASHGNLVNAAPNNFAANGAGWKRVDVVLNVSGSLETSFLVHKINGDLPSDAYGERMPLNKKKLNKTLRDIIELWIDAGAPSGTWVPGTD
jgi:hypothetical protein